MTSILTSPLNTTPTRIDDETLHELLNAWTTNDDLRRRGGSFPERVAARTRLDEARLNVARAHRHSV